MANLRHALAAAAALLTSGPALAGDVLLYYNGAQVPVGQIALVESTLAGSTPTSTPC